jgi:TRAP-type C4-dicarboxylate transport system substrate-binding protein
MHAKVIAPTLILAVALALPGSSEIAEAKKTRYIRLATLVPRGDSVYREFKRLDADLRKATNDAWGVRIYASGIAGDDKDVIRKMRVGQMDSGLVTTTGLSQAVPSVAVLNAPGVINSYRQLEAVQKEMSEEWKDTLLKNERNPIRLMAWWEAGRYRYFSKGPLNSVEDVKKHRAWVWPDSHVLKEIWRAVGTTGVPLGVPDVFGALQTGMVDLVVNTPAALVALRWHLKLDHMTRSSFGVLLLSWVMNDSLWKELPPEAKQVIEKNIIAAKARTVQRSRKEDAVAFKRLIKRGYTVTEWSPKMKKDWEGVQAEVRKRLTGRVYSAALLKRVQSITGRHKN